MAGKMVGLTADESAVGTAGRKAVGMAERSEKQSVVERAVGMEEALIGTMEGQSLSSTALDWR